MNEYLNSLRTRAWRTMGARYNAARRLRRRDLFSTVSIAMFSVASLVLVFVQKAYELQSGTPLDNYLTALSGSLAIFILAISLIEWGAGNGAKADSLHRNAEDLNAYQERIAQRSAELNSGIAVTWQQVEALRIEYETIKERCPHNHAPLDDMHFLAEHRLAPEFCKPNEQPAISNVKKVLIVLRSWWSGVWFLSAFWIVLATLIYITPWHSSGSHVLEGAAFSPAPSEDGSPNP